MDNNTQEIPVLTPPDKAPKLRDLADACHKGACNTGALIIALGDCITEIPNHERKLHPAVKMVIGQVAFLMGEALGPTTEALHAYEEWRKQ